MPVRESLPMTAWKWKFDGNAEVSEGKISLQKLKKARSPKSLALLAVEQFPLSIAWMINEPLYLL